MNPIVIGIDISKRKFDASFSLEGKTGFYQPFENTPRGFQNFVKWLKLMKYLPVWQLWKHGPLWRRLS